MLPALIIVFREGFEAYGLDYAIWGHASDGNMHPNLLPRSLDDLRLAQQVILESGKAVIALGGCPLAEHGVGRNPTKQALLKNLYGESGLEQMLAAKQALDPEGKLAPGGNNPLDQFSRCRVWTALYRVALILKPMIVATVTTALPDVERFAADAVSPAQVRNRKNARLVIPKQAYSFLHGTGLLERHRSNLLDSSDHLDLSGINPV